MSLPLLLFIDDLEEDAEIACYYLRQAGITVDYRTVCTEPGLLTALADLAPSMVLSDILLPQFDPWTALRICRERAPGVPFAIHSGAVSVELSRLAMQRGCVGVADKDRPADLAKLVRLALKLP